MKLAHFTVILLSLLVPAGVIAGEWVTDSTTKCRIWDEFFKPGATASWSGQCVGGCASGSGTSKLSA